ncbi:MAG: 1-acyl-sn-glycerol-3-phosphate acyltransferase, partial [Candidatus Nanopelagicus sp.]
DFSKWQGRAEDPVALEEATAYVMSAITKLLEQLRNESAPSEVFDPKTSELPRIGNFKKDSK